MVFPLVAAGLVRWAAARRRRGLAAGRAVHFRGRLDGRKGRLLADPRLDTPVFLDRAGKATALPRGGAALDANVLTAPTGERALERVGLRYRTPDGVTVRLRLATSDARSVGAWLSEDPGPSGAPAAARRLPLPTAPLWAVLCLAASLLVGLAAADVELLGQHTTARVLRVVPDEGACRVAWSGGTLHATVDCDTARVRVGDPLPIVALPWPFLGEAFDTVTTPTVAAVAGGGFGLLGLLGAVVVTPLACARRVRRAQAAGPALPEGSPAGPEEEAEADWPDGLNIELTYAGLAAAARHGDRHRPGARVSAPRRGPGQTSVSPRRWVLVTVLGTGGWWFLTVSLGAMFDDRFQLGRWRFLVFGAIAVAALARIGWYAVDRSAVCGPVLRAARRDTPDAEWQPMRYVRLRQGPGEMALVLFRADGGEVAPPRFLQPIPPCRGSERRTVGGPAAVGEALVHDTGLGMLVCEIDGVRYLPRGRVTDLAADPYRGRSMVLGYAESHRRSVGRR
ncbi:hypothetical protein [Streptacidiphilus anmyonensis]|uniref:hypothetical protein n=1 Tax=Streptacidiphilus anmyonensis TaxID=405782 RepID=UPI0013648D5A|nr:hypothetical protein [Streptacidiphilus anmyonensis]